MVCFSLTIVSCKQQSKTSILPLPVAAGNGGGGDDGGDVSATAVMLNGSTLALNRYSSYYTAFNNAGYGLLPGNADLRGSYLTGADLTGADRRGP